MKNRLGGHLSDCVDANVYISAIAFGGKPLKIIERALSREFLLISGANILQEVRRNRGGADILVTGDKKHLLPLKNFQGVVIEPPSAFLARLDAAR